MTAVSLILRATVNQPVNEGLVRDTVAFLFL